MTSAADANETVSFGPFRLHIGRRKLLCGKEQIRLGGRAMDILLALAQRPDQLLTKEDLLAAGWPGIFVHESNLKVTIASLRRSLRDYGAAECLKTVVGRGYWLSTETDAMALASAADMAPTSMGASLPHLGTVIGRDAEIGRLRETLARQRLTTLAGAGGVGKTTVAIAAAHLFEDEDGASVAFVDLSRVASEEFVVISLAAALGVNSESGDPLQAVIAILSRRKALLLFDTCEHVLHAVARICDIVLDRTADVRILATSRTVLGARQEHVVWLSPLEVPPKDQQTDLADVLRYSAPQLLTARAFERTGYRPANEDGPAIAEICRRLDGAPLATELVSARFSGRTAELVLKELDNRFRTLRSDRSGAPLRQQTLLITLEWSYALLRQEEAAMLRAVSVFAGSFDVDAAARVVEHYGLSAADAADAITGLRTKSMLSVADTADELRYHLLDSTKAFASDLLRDYGEQDAVSASHARVQLKIFTRGAKEQATMPARTWRSIYGCQVDDLRKAVDWSLYQSKDVLLGIQLTAAGLHLWQELSMGEEARRNCERALTEFERIGYNDKALKLTLVAGLASLNAYLTTDVSKIIALFETASQLARETNNAAAECLALSAAATFSLLPGHDDSVSTTLDALREAAHRAHDRAALWEADKLSAWLDVYRCELQSANDRLLALRADMHGYSEGVAPRFHVDQKSSIDIQYGALQWLMGRPGNAIEVIEEAARYAIDLGHGLSLVHALTRGIIFVMLECQHYERARHYAEMLRSVIVRHGLATWLPLSDCYSEATDALSGARRSPEALRAVLKSLQAGTAQLGNNTYCQTLARAMLAIGEVDDASLVIDYIFETGAQAWNMPELLRIRAAIARAKQNNTEAETSLVEALAIADQRGWHAWRLRTGYDLAVLLVDKGDSDRARELLRPIYSYFVDGFDTGDVRNARLLMERLG